MGTAKKIDWTPQCQPTQPISTAEKKFPAALKLWFLPRRASKVLPTKPSVIALIDGPMNGPTEPSNNCAQAVLQSACPWRVAGTLRRCPPAPARLGFVYGEWRQQLR